MAIEVSGLTAKMSEWLNIVWLFTLVYLVITSSLLLRCPQIYQIGKSWFSTGTCIYCVTKSACNFHIKLIQVCK